MNTIFSAITFPESASMMIHKRRRRRFPKEDLVYLPDDDCPTDLDVVARLGSKASHSPGNRRYLKLLLTERPRYMQLGKYDVDEKNAIAKSIYDFVVSTGGRFLQLDRKTGTFFHVPKRICLYKIKIALKDRNFPCNYHKREAVGKPVPSALRPTCNDWELLCKVLNEV